MFISHNIDNININNIFQSEKIKNTIIENSEFIKIFYSDKNSIQKGLTIICNLNLNLNSNNIKNKININYQNNKQLFDKLIELEKKILEQFIFLGFPKYKLSEQLKSNYISLYNLNKNTNNIVYILKISGIWINNNSYGLTFKFLQSNNFTITHQ